MEDHASNAAMIKKAFLATLPIFAGYIVLGIGFGVVLTTKGYSVLWALAMGLFIYAGSMQFVAIDLLTAQAGLITCAITTLMVNARHLFYGISVIDQYKGAGAKKPYMIFALTDETFSLVCSDTGISTPADRHRYYFFVSLFDHIYWVSGCFLGALLGYVIPFNTEGIDFALTALFVSVVVEQWITCHNHRPALIGFFSSVVCLIFFGSNDFLIPAMLLITVLLAFFGKERPKHV